MRITPHSKARRHFELVETTNSLISDLCRINTFAPLAFRRLVVCYSGDFSPAAGLSEEALEILQLSVESSYRRFLGQVAENRSMSIDQVESLAGGRIWTGRDALQLGLVDELGNVDAAIDAAAVGGGVVGPDVIRVGFIYQPGSVTPLGDPALLDFSVDSLGQDRSRTAVAQTFVENETGEVFTAVVNHFKSKSGSEIDNSGGECESNPTYADCDQGDGQLS